MMGEQDNEPWVLRPSPWAAVEAFGRVLVIFLALLVPLALAFLIPLARKEALGPAPELLAGLIEMMSDSFGLLLATAAAFLPVVRILFTSYTIDGEGIRVRTQILATSDHRVSWEKVTAVRHRRTVLDRLFGIERVDVIAYGARGATLRLVGLHQGTEVRNRAARAMRLHCSMGALTRND